MDIQSWDWGSVPDWLAAIGTLAAVVFALAVATRDAKRLEVEQYQAARDREVFRQEQQEQAAQRKRRLAAQVTLITEETALMAIGMADVLKPNFETFVQRNYTVHNGGEEPIFMATVVDNFPMDGNLAGDYEARTIETWNVIEPDGRRTTAATIDPAAPSRREVQFNDGAGHRWQRQELGELREVSPDVPGQVGSGDTSPVTA
ncbi:hypothetical protein LVY72_12375 [Arthrobacter sp. I2-34]|uniref:Uncharacterized protein n=1 Tax=Arthrobacter hankyongi TaxID=2904801 RepID=A0ABS9L7Q6_9MICC|nr:hypothetical protein [Arthrobacter hankyongi]MCG2622699.1 hypothetical protein [Arthrobacter hankyongi]